MNNNGEDLDRNMKDRSLRKYFALLRPAPRRDAKAIAAGRQQYMRQVDTYRAHGRAPVATKNGLWGFFTQKNFVMAFVTSMMVLVMLVTSGAGLATASQGTLPGDSLYPVKTFGEDVRLAFTTDTFTKFDLLGNYVRLRIDEIDTLQESGGFIPASVTDRMGTLLNAMLGLAATMDDANLTVALIDLQGTLLGGNLKFDTITSNTPGTGDYDRIQDNFQIILMAMIKKQNRDYLDLTTLGLTDPTGFRYMYAHANQIALGTGTPGAYGPGPAKLTPGVPTDNEWGIGPYTLTATPPGSAYGPGPNLTEEPKSSWGPGQQYGDPIFTEDAAYGPGPNETGTPASSWGIGPYATPSVEPSMKQLYKH